MPLRRKGRILSAPRGGARWRAHLLLALLGEAESQQQREREDAQHGVQERLLGDGAASQGVDRELGATAGARLKSRACAQHVFEARDEKILCSPARELVKSLHLGQC